MSLKEIEKRGCCGKGRRGIPPWSSCCGSRERGQRLLSSPPCTAHEGPWESNNLELRTQSHELENKVKTELKQEALGIYING